jgi:Uma2 family endonuclease
MHEHSYEEYLRFERESQTKHEYIDGLIIAMTGGSADHAGITANISAMLHAQLRGKPCRVFSSDLRIRIEAVNVATYPDVSVVCGKVEIDPKDKQGESIVNPTVLVEVLSPSTAKYVCTDKLEFYKNIPSLREIVLVDHETRRLLTWRRGFGGAWWPQELSSGAAKLESIDCTLDLEEVYRDPLS